MTRRKRVRARQSVCGVVGERTDRLLPVLPFSRGGDEIKKADDGAIIRFESGTW